MILCLAKNFAPDRMAKNMRMQSLAETRAVGQSENPRVINKSGANIAAAQAE